LLGVVILPPATVLAWHGFDPVGRAPDEGGLHVGAGLLQGGQYGPGAVKIVGSPAAPPGAFGFLLALQVVDAALPCRTVLRALKATEKSQDAGAYVRRGRVQQRAVIGEGNFVQVVVVAVGIECADNAVPGLNYCQP